MSPPDILEQMLRKFERRAELDDGDRRALTELPYELRTIEPGRYVAREGDNAVHASLMVSGLSYRHKVTVEGARQILSVHIPGDFVDLENCLLKTADHNVQALNTCEVALIPRQAIIDLIDNHARVARAMWIDTLIDASIFREWIVNVGRRDARSGLCHLLCEFARRLDAAGMAQSDGYELPMTQEQLADALGLTPVHVNRVLKDLDREGLIQRERRYLRIPNWEKLRKAAGFSELYLHLDQVGAMNISPKNIDAAPSGARH
jgi:CRP-like cAMP-binding protein